MQKRQAFQEGLPFSPPSAIGLAFQGFLAVMKSIQITLDSFIGNFPNLVLGSGGVAAFGKVADFPVYLFHKGLAFTTIEDYHTAIAVVHKGFLDSSSVASLSILTKFSRSFYFLRGHN